MVVNDPLGDMLARIRNAQLRRRPKVTTPASNLRVRVLDVLQDEGYIRGYTRVDHHNFAMHPAKHIGAHTKKARAGIVVAEHYASCRQFIDKLIAEIRRTVAIQQDFRFNPALRCCQ